MVNVKSTYDRFEMYEFLKTIITRNANGVCCYRKGWTDEAVAKRFNTHRTTVARMRNGQFGSIKPPTEPSPPPSRTAALEGFEARLARLEGKHWDHGFTERLYTVEAELSELRGRIRELRPRRIVRATRRAKA